MHIRFLLFITSIAIVSAESRRDRLIRIACKREPTLALCSKADIASTTAATTESSNGFIEEQGTNARANRFRALLYRRFDERENNKEGFIEQKETGNLNSSNDELASKIPTIGQLQQLCAKFAPIAERYCSEKPLRKEFVLKCAAYFGDCKQFYTPADPLGAIANAFSSRVALNLGTWYVDGIPFYPINEEGSIGAGNLAAVDFGTWGGGFSQNIGVRDFYSQYSEVGANWYDGKYGVRQGLSVPLVQSLGIEGERHALVDVPLNPREIGRVGVNQGSGFGPYFSENQRTAVDWRRGQVSQFGGIAVPLAGVGVNTGTAVSFPGSDALGLNIGR